MSSSESETEVRGERDIDVIEVFLKELGEYRSLYVIPEFGQKVTHEKLYDFVKKINERHN